jgi:hypothetical protein
MQQNLSIMFSGSHHGGNRDLDTDWRSVRGSQGAARPQPKAGDISQFGKINTVARTAFAPTSVFDDKRGNLVSGDSPMLRTASSPNVFSMSSHPPSLKPSGGLGVSGAPSTAPQRRTLKLLPRTRPVGELPASVLDSGSDVKTTTEGVVSNPLAGATSLISNMDQFYQPQWRGHLIPPQHQPPPSPRPSGAGPPSAALPMSPRNPPIQLQQVPGTPTRSHAVLTMHHPPHPSVPHQSPSATSPPLTPSTANCPTSFVPGKKITIKNSTGQEINLDALKRAPPPILPIAPVVPPSPESSKKDVERPIRIESQEQKERRLAEESAREGESDERPRSSDSFVKANEDAARHQVEARKHRKAEKRKLKKEAKRAEKERKDAEEGAAREERERKEAERAKEVAKQRREAEEEALKAAETAEATRALADADAKPDSLPEEGEIVNEDLQPTTTEETLPSKPASVSPPPAPLPTDLSAKSSEKEPLRIYTSLPSLPSPEHQRKRPRPLNLQTAITSNTPPSLPSTLATARYIEDINRITYPEGIKSPNVELNVNAQRGKFRCVLSAIHIPFGLNDFTF